jgi:hypothetical protein
VVLGPRPSRFTDRRRDTRLVGQVLRQGDLGQAHWVTLAVGDNTGNRTAYEIGALERGAIVQLDSCIWPQDWRQVLLRKGIGFLLSELEDVMFWWRQRMSCQRQVQVGRIFRIASGGLTWYLGRLWMSTGPGLPASSSRKPYAQSSRSWIGTSFKFQIKFSRASSFLGIPC